jgi:hypothetical protein
LQRFVLVPEEALQREFGMTRALDARRLLELHVSGMHGQGLLVSWLRVRERGFAGHDVAVLTPLEQFELL